MSEEAAPQQGIFISNEQAQAVNVLLAAANVAQSKGAFSFADSEAVFGAVKCFMPPKAEDKPESDEEVGSD